VSLSDSRAELAGAIEAADTPAIRVFAEPSGQFATPCARVHPASPWVAPSVLRAGKRTQRWEVWVVVGRVDAVASFKLMETMVGKITTALDKLPGWSLIIWDRPAPTDMGGVLYHAVRGTIETSAEV
jgi:hypothetical protein